MNQRETIISVIEAFAEADRLRIENRMLKERMERMAAQDGAMTPLERSIYEYGRRRLFEEYGDTYLSGRPLGTECVDGEDVPESYGTWLGRVFLEYPDFMSRMDFEAEYDAELREKYVRLRETGGE